MADKRMLLRTCMEIYQVRSSILDALSATDASALVWVLGITLTDREKRKYLNVLRDIPEHKEWIESMVSAGNKVMLIGSDLDRLFERINRPGSYLRDGYRLCLWLAVVPWQVMADDKFLDTHLMTYTGEFEDLLATGMTPHPTSGIWWRDYEIGPPGGGKCASTAFLCRFDHMTALPGFHEDWHISTLPNENNITIVFFLSRNTAKFGMKACVEPCVREFDSQNTVDRHAISCHVAVTGGREPPKDGTGFNIPLLALRPGPEARRYAVAWYDVNEERAGVSDGLPRNAYARRPEVASTEGIVLSALDDVTRSDRRDAQDFIIPL